MSALLFKSDIDLDRNQAVNHRLENRTSAFASPLDGMLYFDSQTGARRIRYVIDQSGGTEEEKYEYIPRLDLAETVSGLYTFSRSTSAPFAVLENSAKVTHLDADKLDGLHAVVANTATSVCARDSNGRTQVSDPSADLDAVNYGFMRSWISGMRDPKEACRVASTAAMLASRVSSTLTATVNGSINGGSFDGITTIAINDRVLMKNQLASEDNGIYIVTDLGSAGTPWVMQRAADADSSAEVTNGMYTVITDGALGQGTHWLLVTADPISLNSTGLTFIQISAPQSTLAGNGLVRVGNTVHFAQSASYTTGAIPFAASTSTIGFDAVNLFWDDTNNRLGIGTTTPGSTIDATGNITARGQLWSGVNDTTSGILGLYGHATGTTTGGTIALYNAADHDSNNEYWAIQPVSANLRIGPNNAVNSFYFTETGRFGINTVTPLARLHLVGPSTAPGGSAPVGAVVVGTTGSNGSLEIGNDATSTFYSWIQSRNNTSASVYTLALNPSGGSVAVGTTAPDSGFHVKTSSGSYSILERSAVNGAGYAGVLELRTDAKTIGDGILLWFTAKDSGDAAQTYGRIVCSIVSPTAGAEQAELSLWTVTGGSYARGLTLTHDGLLGVGVAAPAVAAHVSNASAANTEIRVENTGSAYAYLRAKAVARYAAFLSETTTATAQTWATGQYGSASWQVYNVTAGAAALLVGTSGDTYISRSLRVGAMSSDPGDNNLAVDGTATVGSLASAGTKVLTATSAGLIQTSDDITVVNLTASTSATVPTPTTDYHAATKAYVDAIGAGLRPKTPARVATAAALPTNSRTGDVLTASANGSINVAGIDSVTTLALNDRVLVKDESTAANNGMFYVSQVGDGSNPWTLTRTSDCDSAGEVTKGMYCYVSAGSTNVGRSYFQTETVSTLNSDALAFIIFYQGVAYAEGVGIDITGLTISLDQAVSPTWTGAHTFKNTNGVRLDPYGTSTGETTSIRFVELALNGTNYVGLKAPDAISANTLWTMPSADGSANHYLKTNGSGVLSFAQIASAEINNATFVTSVSGTSGRITVTGTLTPTIDIASTYVGQNTITTLGTIGTGVWNGTAISNAYGGTGQNSSSWTGIVQVSSGTWAINNDLPAASTINSKAIARKYAVAVGNTSSVSFNVTHSLGTRDVVVAVFQTGSPYSLVMCDVTATDTNTVTVTFATAPSTNEFTVVVVG